MEPAINPFAITFGDRFLAAETRKRTAGNTASETDPVLAARSVTVPAPIAKLHPSG